MDNNLVINLYKKQFRIICLYLVKCGCNVSDAEDIVHDSFVKAIEYIDGVDDNIKNIPDGKVIEMAISFDKPYKIDDMFMIGKN